MKTIAGFLLFVSFVVGFTSCQREIDPSILNRPVNDSGYIKMFFTRDTTFISKLDTLEKFLFFYDASKRIKRVDFYDYKPGVSGVQDFGFVERSYKGIDTLPYKVVFKGVGSSVIDSTFIFRTNGIVEKDSTVTDNQTRIMSYYLWTSSERIIQRRLHYNAAGNHVYTDSSLLIRKWVTPSKLSSSDSIYNGPPNSVLFDFGLLYTTDYDNKPNPFKMMAAGGYPVDALEVVSEPGLFFGAKYRNNIIKFTFTIPPPLYTYTNTYFYRSDGLPVTMYTNADQTFKSTYIYQRL
jgi:hypothetical protein